MPPEMQDGPRPVTGGRPKQIAASSITRRPVTGRGAALEAARRGWAVFPCRPDDKRPAVPDWENRACSDPERVGRYWPSDQHNIGIACGPSRLVVVDLDTHGHLPEDWRQLPGIRDGRDVLAQLAEWAGKPWPSTYMVATANGGWHLYFTAPEASGIRNSASLLGPLVDVRGAGGYVVAAGSRVDGKPYELLDVGDTVPLPAWICQLLAPAAASSPTQGRRGVPPGARMQGLLEHGPVR